MQARIRALILDRQHRCLLRWKDRADGGCWTLPGIDLAVDTLSTQRPLVTLQTTIRAELGLELPSPSGSYVPEDGRSPRDFAFILQAPPDIAGTRFMPLHQAQAELAQNAEAELLRRLYIETLLGGYELPQGAFDVFYFGSEPAQAAKLAHLVVKGKKRGTSGFIAAAEKQGSTIPHPGLLSVVTDYHGYPLCVIETVEVRKLKFRDITPELAAEEGEGDLSYADWREGHVAYFTREAAEHELTFDDDSLIFNERFRVVAILGQADPS